jgi:DNA-binding MarR family transcriptional regulator
MLAYLSDHAEGQFPSELARILRTSPATISVSARKLDENRLVSTARWKGRARLAITKAGFDIARDADLVLAQTHEEYFSALTPQQKAVVDTGSMITNKDSSEGNRMRDGHFFSAFETLQAFLVFEEFLTNATRSCGLSLNEFRVLFEIDQNGGAASLGKIGESLILPPSTTCYVVDGLEGSGFVGRKRSRSDKRSNVAELTDAGRRVFSSAITRVEAVFTTDLRSSGATERNTYKDAAAIVVSSLRKGRRKR